MATSADICGAIDNNTEFFCHVCMADQSVRYAKIDADNQQVTVYGEEMPACATESNSKEHLRAFSRECFPHAMGDLRRAFFAGYDTISCKRHIPKRERQHHSWKMIVGVIWTVIFVLFTAYIASIFVSGRAARKRPAKIHMPASPASSLPSPMPRVIQIPYQSLNRV